MLAIATYVTLVYTMITYNKIAIVALLKTEMDSALRSDHYGVNRFAAFRKEVWKSTVGTIEKIGESWYLFSCNKHESITGSKVISARWFSHGISEEGLISQDVVLTVEFTTCGGVIDCELVTDECTGNPVLLYRGSKGFNIEHLLSCSPTDADNQAVKLASSKVVETYITNARQEWMYRVGVRSL